MRFKFINHITG